jgi:hypothetical protein
MANLTIVAAEVSPIRVFEQMTGPAAEAIDAGEVVRLDTTSGKFTLANASTAAEGRAIGVAVNSGIAQQAITVVKRGYVDMGDALTAEDYDESLELSDTDGKIDDSGGGTVTVAIGRVVPAWGATTADKVLFVDIAV